MEFKHEGMKGMKRLLACFFSHFMLLLNIGIFPNMGG